MKNLLAAGCAALLVAAIGAPLAHADTVWTLQNAQFGYWVDASGSAAGMDSLGPDLGTPNGSFTLDNVGNVTDFNLVTTGSGNNDIPYFGGWIYNNSTAAVTDTNGAGNPFTLLQFTNTAAQETLSLVFVRDLLNAKTIGSGYSLLCTTANASTRLACDGAASSEFLTSGNPDHNDLAANDPYRALSPLAENDDAMSLMAVGGPSCGGAACVRSLVVKVPEPGTLPLLLSALVGLGFIRSRRPRRAA